jgi:hypothetical protein
MANNKDNNFGLPFDLPDYEDMEAMLDEMVEKENGFRTRYKEELQHTPYIPNPSPNFTIRQNLL